MTRWNADTVLSKVFEAGDAFGTTNFKAASFLAAGSIALGGAFVIGLNNVDREAMNWLMPVGGILGLVAAVQSVRASVVDRLEWLAGGTATLAITAALATGLVLPVHALIAACSLATGLAFSFGDLKPSLEIVGLNNKEASTLASYAALSGGDIVHCDRHSEIIAASNRHFKAGSALLDCVHVPDRPAFLLGLSAATNANQTLTVRMKINGRQHFTETRVELQCHGGELLAALFNTGNLVAINEAHHVRCELAHELRAPLAAMVGLADAIDDNQTCTPEMRASYPALIAQAGRSLIELTTTILQDKTSGSALPQVKLGAVTRECFALLQPMAKQQAITLYNRVPEILTDRMVESGAMRQILTNLITNAVKFSPAGASVEVNAFVSANGWTLSVVDNGNGIAPEDVVRLGQWNFRGDKTAGISGFGLGLSIVHRLVEEMGARISFESRPGKGTRVEIAFSASTLVELADFQSQAAVMPVANPRYNKAAGEKHAAA